MTVNKFLTIQRVEKGWFLFKHNGVKITSKLAVYVCKNKKNSNLWLLFCGERGIRTPGTSRYGGFQDRCNRPLYHLSSGVISELRCKDTTIFEITKRKSYFFI